MTVLIVIAVIMIASVIFFYLKSPLLTSVAMLFSAIIAVLVSFNYYELLANLLLSKGHGGQWAHSGCLILLFVITFALIRVASDQIVGANIDLGNVPKIVVSIVCGLAVGFIIAGVVVIALAMAPLSPSIPYERFSGRLDADRVSSSKSMMADSFVSGLVKIASKGSFSSKKSFDVYHADFLDQLHINRKGLGEGDVAGVPMIAGEKSITVPSKNNVRTTEDNLTVVRAGIKSGTIEKGGSVLEGSAIMFTPGQLRLLCKKEEIGNTKGSAIAVYPMDYQLLDMEMKERDDEEANIDLNEMVSVDARSLSNRHSSRAVWMDLYYKVPSGYQAVFLQFRNHVIVDLSKPVDEPEDSEDLWQQPDGDE